MKQKPLDYFVIGFLLGMLACIFLVKIPQAKMCEPDWSKESTQITS